MCLLWSSRCLVASLLVRSLTVRVGAGSVGAVVVRLVLGGAVGVGGACAVGGICLGESVCVGGVVATDVA